MDAQQISGGSDNSSATTVLISVLIVLIIGIAFYFGFVRGNPVDTGGGGVNVELNAPAPSGGSSPAPGGDSAGG